MATITLDYFIESDSVPLSVLLARATLAGATIFEGELDLLGYTNGGFAAVITGGRVRCRVIFTTNAVSDSRFPTDAARAYSTKNLYRASIANRVPAFVTAADPVIT
jgi:hypothetical protein